MKATGIVRRIDDLGRVVIPKEIRRTLKIRESGSQFPWLLVGYSIAVALTAVGILLFYRVRKMKREDEEEDG